ncbi:MAG: C25 family cysteine peptidase [candidate division Zixibacteria bacterium]|nr:C25 family cysteine peptidase [candidate division Zixibacteria bacterium]
MNKSRLLFGCCILLLIITIPSIISSDVGYRLQYVTEFSREELSFDNLLGYDRVLLKDATSVKDVAKPMLPLKEIMIALPPGLSVREVRVIDEKAEELPGKYMIIPNQPPMSMNFTEEEIEFVGPDQQVYSSIQPYPAKLAQFIRQSDLAGQGIAHILVYPLQYIPSEKRLVFYSSLTLEIEGTYGYECGDYLSPNISQSSREVYQQMIEDLVVNPEDVQLNTGLKAKLTNFLPNGSFNHVIITSSPFVPFFQPLVDWHIKRGLTDTVVTVTDIYSIYSGSTDQKKIRNFIIDAHSSWGTIYFLIGGEETIVPFEYRNYWSEAISDQYYSDYDDDWIHEVFVGRIPVSSTETITTFVNKVLRYEKNPPRTDYLLNVLFIGMDPNKYIKWEELKEYIEKDAPIPSRFNVTKVYDSHEGDHLTAAINALNAGQHLVNHSDHAFDDLMCTGYWKHYGLGIKNSHVDSLTNDGKLSIIVSSGCSTNKMNSRYHECIAEHFVEYNPDQAGVAFFGSTYASLFSNLELLSLSPLLDYYWWQSLMYFNKYNLGQILAYSKHRYSQGYNLDMYVEWIFNLLGEPEMSIWTDEPDSFAVSFPYVFSVGTSSFTVHVEDSSTHTPVDKAYVCLWKGDEVYLRGNTNSSGDKTFYPSPSTNGVMYVTVTKHNYIPYEGQAVVANPLVSTNPATYEEETSATIHGYLEDDAGYEASCWFFWDTDSGEPYANRESLGVFSNGSEYSKELTGLTEGTLYYFKAKAHNMVGWGEGDELMFLTKPLSPAQFTAEAISCSTVTLSWNKPSSADGVVIERNDSLFWKRGEGELVCNDTTESFEDSGLDPLTQYYYQVWSYRVKGN